MIVIQAYLPLEFFDGPNLDSVSHTPQRSSEFEALRVVGCDDANIVVV
jgi:hypothetical protein